MDLTPGLRRASVPSSDAASPASDPELEARIRAEITTSGPITFARFMELALYDPDGGYYRRKRPGPGRAGDFLTAPEMHPLFGATLARVVADAWRSAGSPPAFALIEYGAGSGALAAPLLEALRDSEPDLLAAIHYVPIEINEYRMADLRERLADADLGATIKPGPAPTVGIAIANEYLDALPVHLIERRGDHLIELHVSVAASDGLVLVPGPPSTPELAGRLAAEGVVLAEGQRAEICLGIDGWADDVSRRLERGSIVVIDYGAPADDLYGPKRPAGTLMAYAGHRAMDDPLVGIGHQDLTAHIDFTAAERALSAHDWQVGPLVSQAEFLVASGMESVLALLRGRASDIESQLALRSAAGRLLDPRATGGFRVLEASRAGARPAAIG